MTRKPSNDFKRVGLVMVNDFFAGGIAPRGLSRAARCGACPSRPGSRGEAAATAPLVVLGDALLRNTSAAIHLSLRARSALL